MEVTNVKCYKKGIVYKLYGSDINDDTKTHIYIGSTINALCNRKAIHKYHHKLYQNNIKAKCSSSDIFDKCNNIVIEAIETLENISREQLREIENKYILQYDCVNKNRAHNDDEYMKEYYRKHAKKYYYKHHETELAKKKAYYNANKEKFRQKYQDNKEEYKKKSTEYMKKYLETQEGKIKKKEYREKNKDKLNEYSKNYYHTVTKPAREKKIII
jgi:hypothetical protein